MKTEYKYEVVILKVGQVERLLVLYLFVPNPPTLYIPELALKGISSFSVTKNVQ